MRRRDYLPIDKKPQFAIYHELYDNLRFQSQILNAGNVKPGLHQIIWDRTNVQFEITNLTGDERGQVRNSMGDATLSKLPEAKFQLENVEKKFSLWKKNRQLQGYAVSEEWPRELLAERLRYEAQYDVMAEELKVLQDWLSNYTDTEEIADFNNVLAYGLRCSGHLHGTRDDPALTGVLKEIDGQKCGFVGETLCITDTRSPYRGLSVENYRTLASEWQIQRRKADAEKLKRLQAEAISKGQTAPSQFVSGIKIVDQRSLPKFPTWARNWFKNPKTDNDSKTLIVRTKKSPS